MKGVQAYKFAIFLRLAEFFLFLFNNICIYAKKAVNLHANL